jgi:hypothetical protein
MGRYNPSQQIGYGVPRPIVALSNSLEQHEITPQDAENQLLEAGWTNIWESFAGQFARYAGRVSVSGSKLIGLDPRIRHPEQKIPVDVTGELGNLVVTSPQFYSTKVSHLATTVADTLAVEVRRPNIDNIDVAFAAVSLAGMRTFFLPVPLDE